MKSSKNLLAAYLIFSASALPACYGQKLDAYVEADRVLSLKALMEEERTPTLAALKAEAKRLFDKGLLKILPDLEIGESNYQGILHGIGRQKHFSLGSYQHFQIHYPDYFSTLSRGAVLIREAQIRERSQMLGQMKL